MNHTQDFNEEINYIKNELILKEYIKNNKNQKVIVNHPPKTVLSNLKLAKEYLKEIPEGYYALKSKFRKRIDVYKLVYDLIPLNIIEFDLLKEPEVFSMQLNSGFINLEEKKIQELLSPNFILKVLSYNYNSKLLEFAPEYVKKDLRFWKKVLDNYDDLILKYIHPDLFYDINNILFLIKKVIEIDKVIKIVIHITRNFHTMVIDEFIYEILELLTFEPKKLGKSLCKILRNELKYINYDYVSYKCFMKLIDYDTDLIYKIPDHLKGYSEIYKKSFLLLIKDIENNMNERSIYCYKNFYENLPEHLKNDISFILQLVLYQNHFIIQLPDLFWENDEFIGKFITSNVYEFRQNSVNGSEHPICFINMKYYDTDYKINERYNKIILQSTINDLNTLDNVDLFYIFISHLYSKLIEIKLDVIPKILMRMTNTSLEQFTYVQYQDHELGLKFRENFNDFILKIVDKNSRFINEFEMVHYRHMNKDTILKILSNYVVHNPILVRKLPEYYYKDNYELIIPILKKNRNVYNHLYSKHLLIQDDLIYMLKNGFYSFDNLKLSTMKDIKFHFK